MPRDPAAPPPLDRKVFAARYGPRALVAGGAVGMGAEYCRQIAATGLDLLILDRDEPALAATAAELRSAPGAVDVATAVVDLGQPADRLLDALRRAVGDREIGLVVANAAWSPVGPFLDVDLTALLAAIDINCRAPVVLAHELGARMVARGRGGIIIMSSLAAESGAAQVALYSAATAASTSSRSGPARPAHRDGSPANPRAAICKASWNRPTSCGTHSPHSAPHRRSPPAPPTGPPRRCSAAWIAAR